MQLGATEQDISYFDAEKRKTVRETVFCEKKLSPIDGRDVRAQSLVVPKSSFESLVEYGFCPTRHFGSI